MIQRTLLMTGLLIALSSSAQARLVDVNFMDKDIIQMWQQNNAVKAGLVQSGLLTEQHDDHAGHDDHGVGGDDAGNLMTVISEGGAIDVVASESDALDREIQEAISKNRFSGAPVELNNQTLRERGFTGGYASSSFGESGYSEVDPRTIFEVYPVPNARITSRYGYRSMGGRGEFHPGIDLAAPYGTPVYATGSGMVVYAGWKNGYGNFIVIDHGNGYVTRYAHHSRILVSVGDQVTKGQHIAAVGSTGRSTGPHVHYEVYRHGTRQNPSTYLAMTTTGREE